MKNVFSNCVILSILFLIFVSLGCQKQTIKIIPIITIEAESYKDSYGEFNVGQYNGNKTVTALDKSEWLAYDVNVEVPGRYRCEINLSSESNSSGSCWIEDYYDNQDGRTYNITATIPVPATRKGGKYSIVSKDGCPLNAGIHKMFVSTIDFTQADWNEMIDINLKSVWLCMKYEIPQMLKQGKGAIVNTSSAAGLIAAPSNPAYSASKHGVVGLTKSTGIEFARRGIRVNCICPGPTRTAMHDSLVAAAPQIVEMMHTKVPMGRIAEPEEVAAAAVWLCSDEASYITGHALPVDGGLVAD